MLYHHRFVYGSAVSALASARAESSFVRRRRRALSVWGLGAAAGLLNFPLRSWSGEPDPDPDPDPGPELAGELCPAPAEGALLAPEESCDLPAEAASASHEPALLTVLGSDVRLEDLPGLPGLPDPAGLPGLSEDLILAQAPEGGGGLFGVSWPVVALVGGGGLLVVAVLASGGSDSDDGDGGGGAMNATPAVVTTGMSAAPATLTATEGMAVSLDVSDWFSDPDAGDTLTYAATGLPAWLELNAMTGALTVAAMDEAEVGVYTLTVTASDPDDETATHTVTLTIEDSSPAPDGMSASNEAPETTTLAETSLTATEGEAATWTVSGWFADPDAGDTLTYAATLQKTDAAMAAGLPDWLALDAMTGSLTIAAMATDDPEVGFYTLVVTASDGDGETAMHTLLLTISDDPTDGMVTDAGPPPAPLPGTDTTPGSMSDSNSAPTLTDEVPTADAPLTVAEGAAETWTLAEWFADPDTGDTLTYTAALDDLPAWLVLDSAMGELTIAAMATDGEAGSHTFTLTASDGGGEAATLTVTLTVETPTPNAAPVVVTGTMAPPTTVTGMEADTAQGFMLSTWFTDPDPGDTLTFALGADGPAWATLNTAMTVLTLAFNDTDDADVETHALEVIATDSGDESVTHTLAITVKNVADAPTATEAAPAMLTAMEGLAFSRDVSSWFADEDAGDTLTYTATGLPAWLALDDTTGTLTIEAGATDDAEVKMGPYTLVVTASDPTKPTALTVSHTATLAITDTKNEPSFVGTLSDRIAPATGGSIVLDLAGVFTDLQEGGTTPGTLTFAVSDSIDDTAAAAENIITAMLDGSMLTLEPGAANGALWQQETIAITATDTEGGRTTAAFAVTTRANVLEVDMLAPAHGFIIQGDAAEDQLGWSVSGAGDINGDGLDDLIVGANEGTDGEFRAGEAYIVYGKAGPGDGTQFGMAVRLAADGTTTITDGTAPPDSVVRQVLDTTDLAPAAGFIIQGDVGGDELGYSVSGAGDVNGDGLDDLIVGAFKGDDGGMDSGEAYVVYGKAGTDGAQFGMRVAINQDGTTTILAANEDASTGAVVRRVLDTTSLVPADGFIIQGDVVNDNLGLSVAGAGDVNGDGLADLIVGAHLGDDGMSNAGEAYIIYGKTGTDGMQFGTAVRVDDDGMTLDLTASDGVVRQVLDTTKLAPAAGFIIQGDVAYDNLGTSVAGAGDVNGDGLGDLIVGAHLGDDGGASAGESYIIYGKTGTDGTQFGTAVRVDDDGMTLDLTASDGVVRQVVDTTSLVPADGFILQGDMGRPDGITGDNLGHSVSGIGDINGDGFDDLIAGTRYASDVALAAGEAYIIYGKANPAAEEDAGTQFGMAMNDRQVLDTSFLAPADGFILQGVERGDTLGYSVAGAGDVNGDGLADLIVGLQQNLLPGTGESGEAYIIYGKAGTDGTQFGTAVRVDDDGMTLDLTASDGVVRQVLDAASLAPTDGFNLLGDMRGDESGSSVSGAGDINGDGYDDFIVGANEGDDGGRNAGEAYIIYGGAHLGEVVSHDQTLTGMTTTAAAGADAEAIEAAERAPFLLGGAGDDRLEAHADTEVLYGGAGDDVLELADSSFRRVDGGSGSDTLVLGMDVALDFTEASDRGRVRGIETLSLSDGAAVTLDLVSVYALVDSRDNGGTHTSAGEAFLRLEGTSGMVTLSGGVASWTKTDEGTADLYTLGSAKLLIDDGLIA